MYNSVFAQSGVCWFLFHIMARCILSTMWQFSWVTCNLHFYPSINMLKQLFEYRFLSTGNTQKYFLPQILTLSLSINRHDFDSGTPHNTLPEHGQENNVTAKNDYLARFGNISWRNETSSTICFLFWKIFLLNKTTIKVTHKADSKENEYILLNKQISGESKMTYFVHN